MIENWDELELFCKSCKKCPLCKTRTNVVFGEGNRNSKILFVGEGPGFNEDVQGRPFVGRSGKLLDELLLNIGLSREKNIFISNIVKCRPPNNRDPLPEEQEICINFLRNQVYIMKPKIIVTLGRISSSKIFDPKIKITVDHGSVISKKGILIMPTFHPAAILRNMNKKKEIEHDFEILKNKIDELNI